MCLRLKFCKLSFDIAAGTLALEYKPKGTMNVLWLRKTIEHVGYLEPLPMSWQQKCTKITEKEKSFKSCSQKCVWRKTVFMLLFFLHQSVMYCDCHASHQPFYFCVWVFVCVCVCHILWKFFFLFICYCGALCHINTYGLHCYCPIRYMKMYIVCA